MTRVTAGTLDAAVSSAEAEVQDLLDAVNALAQIAEEVGGNDNGNPVPLAQIEAVAENVDPALESQYQQALADADAANLMAAEVQTVVDAVNAARPVVPETISLDGVLASNEAEFGGQLINPVAILIDDEWRTIYFWDANGDGDANAGDRKTHCELRELFNGSTSITNDELDRSLTFERNNDFIALRLPTLNGENESPSGCFTGTACTEVEPSFDTYDDLAEIWNAFCGDGVGDIGVAGVPGGRAGAQYTSPTLTGTARHARIRLGGSTDSSWSNTSDGIVNYVVL